MDRRVFLITVCVLERRPILAQPLLAEAVLGALREAREADDWRVGKYVIMPDHTHFFCGPGGRASSLSAFVGRFKALSTRRWWELGYTGRLWQREFHDHLLRSSESYEEKWDYVAFNPVRAGLCSTPEEWPYAGNMDQL